MLRVQSKSFQRLVAGLKEHGKTCTVVESCCGGLINASIMAVPGSSSVYYGGSVAYNTRRARKLLLDDQVLHDKLTQPFAPQNGEGEGDTYIRSKQNWTSQTAVSFCEQLDVDYCIAEGGASGPTFRPKDMDNGFAVISIAGRNKDTGRAELLAQKTILSPHADRQLNMHLFADAAATLAADTIGIGTPPSLSNEGQSTVEASQHLDRATHLRTDEAALQKLEQRLDAKYIILKGGETLFVSDTKLAFVGGPPSPLKSHRTFLGIEASGAPIFAIDLDDEQNSALQWEETFPANAHFENTRTHAPLLSPYENELVLYATALTNWKRTHKFCAVCGKPLLPVQGGTCLRCTECQNLSWCRQDPSIIVLVTNREGDKALLGRSSRHPRKVHTALAGFVEAGEPFEKAVAREVFEETGAVVDIGSIRYLSSQPWPFPRSCMVAFRATADESLPLKIDPNELEDAAWFDRSEVAKAAEIPGAVMNKDVAEAALASNPSLQLPIPPTSVVARTLIDHWLHNA